MEPGFDPWVGNIRWRRKLQYSCLENPHGQEGPGGLQSCFCCCLVTSVDSVLCYGLKSTRLLCPWDFLGKNTGRGCHFILQGIFLTQGSNLHALHQQADSLPPRHLGRPQKILIYSNQNKWLTVKERRKNNCQYQKEGHIGFYRHRKWNKKISGITFFFNKCDNSWWTNVLKGTKYQNSFKVKNIYDQNFPLSVQKFKSQLKNFPQRKLQVQVALFINYTKQMNK